MGNKKIIELFVSYARSNNTLAKKFLDRYGEHTLGTRVKSLRIDRRLLVQQELRNKRDAVRL